MPQPLCFGMHLTAKAFFLALFFGAFASAQAELSWEKSEIELHPKPTDADAVANFKYENKGDKPIKITSVKSSCGCTVATLKKDTVAPGETGEVTATFHIGGHTGVQQKAVTVTTDDPAQPLVNLNLKVVIPVAMEIQPTFVFWESGAAPTPKTIRVKAGKEYPINKLEVSSSSKDFKTSVEKGSEPGEYTITVTPTQTAQMDTAMLTIKSDQPQSFFATARVIGPPATVGR